MVPFLLLVADAEDRFLLVERRLRDVVVRALRNSALLSFVVGLETLLEAFSKVFFCRGTA